jgi:predicted hydrolase (HD superfamily)
MTAESPVKVIDEETTKKRFKKKNFIAFGAVRLTL